MRGFIVANLGKENIVARTQAVIRELGKCSVEAVMEESVKGLFQGEKVAFLPKEECLSTGDLILSIGGDGTILHIAQDAVRYDLPVLGINAGRVGFLTSLEQEEISSLHRLITGEYQTEERMLIETKVGNDHIFAINDIVLTRGANARIVDIEVMCEDKSLYTLRGDGVILSTPTGSTAYAMSAGGPVVDPAIQCFSLTPICPYSLFNRPILFSPERTVTLRAKQINNDGQLMLSADGAEGIPIAAGQSVTVVRSDKVLKLIRFSEKGFYQVLNKKLMLGGGCQ